MKTPPHPAVARLPTAPGVYRFRDERDRVLYIGRATDLHRRVASYWANLGDRPRLATMVAQVREVDAVICDSVHEAAWLERNALEHRLPPWNRAVGGQEVPLCIRLDRRPGSAGLTAVHTPVPTDDACYFGPYLGGNKVRLAVFALRRLLPFAYAAGDPGAGGDDMVRDLGLERGDRDALLDTLGAVLRRDPAAVAAVRAALQRRRDAAAEALAFERAAQRDAEVRAVAWVVAEQKAATLDPCDLDVHGWADGVHITFEIRAGRLRHWRYDPSSEADARPAVAATPPAYAAFANRNAVLACRLAANISAERPSTRPTGSYEERRQSGQQSLH